MKLLIILITVILVGCASTAPSHSYRPRGSNDEAWSITGQYNELTGNIIISINGVNAIDSNVSVWDGSGEFYAQYQGKSISASCNHIVTIQLNYLKKVLDKFFLKYFQFLQIGRAHV